MSTSITADGFKADQPASVPERIIAKRFQPWLVPRRAGHSPVLVWPRLFGVWLPCPGAGVSPSLAHGHDLHAQVFSSQSTASRCSAGSTPCSSSPRCSGDLVGWLNTRPRRLCVSARAGAVASVSALVINPPDRVMGSVPSDRGTVLAGYLSPVSTLTNGSGQARHAPQGSWASAAARWSVPRWRPR